jgi:hypothetical protein
LERLSGKQLIQTPAIVVRRAAYEKLGGFRSDLPYTLDWEMWSRIASQYFVWYEPAILACYRLHEASETSRLSRASENMLDIIRCIEINSSRLPSERSQKLKTDARRHYALWALSNSCALFRKKEFKAAFYQIRGALKCSFTLKMAFNAFLILLCGYFFSRRLFFRNFMTSIIF